MSGSLDPCSKYYNTKINGDSPDLTRGLNPSDRNNCATRCGDGANLACGLYACEKNKRVTCNGDIPDLPCGCYTCNKDNNRTCPRRLEQGKQHVLRQRFKLIQRQLRFGNL